MSKPTKNRFGGALRCHGCETLGATVDGRFCTADCRNEYHDKHEAALTALVNDGWVLVEGSESLFLKDGQYRTVEEQMKCL